MDVSVELPEEISIELPGGKYKLQTIEYEWRLLYCQSCLNIGHQNSECKKATFEKGKQQMNRRKLKMGRRVKVNQEPSKPVTNAEQQVEPELLKEVGEPTDDQNGIEQYESMEFQLQQPKIGVRKNWLLFKNRRDKVSFMKIVTRLRGC